MKPKLVLLTLFFAPLLALAQVRIGRPAPALQFTGPAFSLAALKGKVVLVDFWASWCKACRYDNHSLAPVYNRYRDKGFEIVGISVDHDSTAWQNAIRADGIGWRQFNENGKWNRATAGAWGVKLLPTSFLIDKQGKVISIDPSAAELQRYLQEALK
ncbi:MAG: thioredoxin-like domain-containing protein [Flavihumibacter sp.]